MEEERKILFFLEQIPQSGFLVKDNRIFCVNQAAAAILLSPGQDFLPLLLTGSEEYAILQEGSLCLALSVGGISHDAVITRMEDFDLVILDQQEDPEEFRSMALVSMELRTPLMQAIHAAQQLETENPAAAKMNQSLMQMLRMVSNMADISRYTASSRMEVRDVDALLLELFEKAQVLLEGTTQIIFEGMKQPVFSRIDSEQLERAVWNILSNCVKFMPKGGRIHAKLTRQGRMLRLTIEDSGSGIAEQVRNTLFQRYLRQPGIEDSRYGLGLGLAIVRTAAANHGGTVLIGSSREGGTRITLTMTIRQEEDTLLRSPLLRPDYTGGFDHGLVELSDCLSSEFYQNL